MHFFHRLFKSKINLLDELLFDRMSLCFFPHLFSGQENVYLHNNSLGWIQNYNLVRVCESPYLKCQIDIGKNRCVILEQRDQIQTRLLTEVVSSDVTCCYRRSKQIGNYSILIIFFFRVEFFLIILPKNFAFQKGKKSSKCLGYKKK